MQHVRVWFAAIVLCAASYADNANSLVWSTFLGGNDEDINQDLVAEVRGALEAAVAA